MATATVNGNLPTGYTGNDHQVWGADDDSTQRSWGIDNPRSFEIPYHGSCPKCHHLHTNRPLKVSRDPTVHTRFECDACRHPILGIGRASTQTTLASVESIPQQPSDRISGTSGPSRLQICVNAPRAVVQLPSTASPDHLSALAQLSTITEANTLAGRSRSTSNLAAPELNSPGHDNSRTLSTAASPQASVVGGGLPPPAGAEDYRQPQTQSSSRFRFKTFFLQGKWRLLSSRYMKIFRYRKAPPNPPIDPTDPPSKPDFSPRPNSLTTHESITGVRDTPGDDPNLNETPLGPPLPDMSEERPPLNFPSEQPQGLFPNPIEPSVETSNGPEASDDSGTHTEDHAQARDVKRDRIHAKRREATLKNEAARKPVCDCGPGCPCLGNDRDSDVDSRGHSRTSSMPVPEIPYLPVAGIMTGSGSGNRLSQGFNASLNFVGIGGHVNTSQLYVNRSTSIAENSSSGADSSRLQTNRLSQATTAWGSNDSSISLAARLSYRSGGRVSLQNHDSIHEHHGSATDPGTADLPTRERAGSVPNDFNRDTSDESSTSLANLPDPGSEQGGPPQMSNATMSSAQASHVDETPEQSGSQERTPRPHSYQATVDDASNTTSEPALDRLSTALEDHVRAQVYDTYVRAQINDTSQGSRRGA